VEIAASETVQITIDNANSQNNLHFFISIRRKVMLPLPTFAATMRTFTKWIPVLGLLFFVACSDDTGKSEESDSAFVSNNGIAAPVMLQAALMAEYPHDTAAFTEGLFIHEGKLYESTGNFKESFIQLTDLKTGKVFSKYPIKDSTIFGEGSNILNGKLFQLTYQNNLVYVYDVKDLSKPIKTYPWPSEGWGMTNNGKELIISDGKKQGTLYFVDPETFRQNRIVQVSDNYGPVNFINELEYIDGFIYANIWGSTQIIKIDPSNGHVVGKLETAEILKSFYSSYKIEPYENVLNGIAYDSTQKKMYITGKNWPKLFELQLN
jgi:glutaminyl-peptide cyclotransferase